MDAMVLYCAADLLWATRIKATADSLGIPCRPARSVEMLKARLADSDVKALILDLDAAESSLSLVAALRGGGDSPGLDPGRKVRVLAFGPHVAVELFEKARAAGADEVLARGAFDRRLREILAGLNGDAADR
jgi:hypothetical protein